MENTEVQNIVDAMFKKLNEDDKSSDLYKNLNETIEKMQKNFDNFETEYKKNTIQAGQNQNFSTKLKSKLSDNVFQTAVDNLIKGNKGNMNYSFEMEKNASVILDPTSFGSIGVAPVVLPMREAGVDKPQVRPMAVSDLITWGPCSSNTVDWIERSGKTNASAMRAEGSAMAQGDVRYQERSTAVKIASEHMKVTNESLKDVDFLASEINSELISDLKILVDTQLLSGDGTGNNLKGITQYASTFSPGAGNLALTGITLANDADVLLAAITQILYAGAGNWYPNAILMNPYDIARLQLLKISDGRYIEIPFYNYEGSSVLRVPIYANTGIDVRTFLVGDFTKAKAFLRDPLAIRVWDQNSDDPEYNRSTVTANIRLAFRVKRYDEGAFVYGNFDTAKALMA